MIVKPSTHQRTGPRGGDEVVPGQQADDTADELPTPGAAVNEDAHDLEDAAQEPEETQHTGQEQDGINGTGEEQDADDQEGDALDERNPPGHSPFLFGESCSCCSHNEVCLQEIASKNDGRESGLLTQYNSLSLKYKSQSFSHPIAPSRCAWP